MTCSSEAWTFSFIGYFPSVSGFACGVEALDEAKGTLVCEGWRGFWENKWWRCRDIGVDSERKRVEGDFRHLLRLSHFTGVSWGERQTVARIRAPCPGTVSLRRVDMFLLHPHYFWLFPEGWSPVFLQSQCSKACFAERTWGLTRASSLGRSGKSYLSERKRRACILGEPWGTSQHPLKWKENNNKNHLKEKDSTGLRARNKCQMHEPERSKRVLAVASFYFISCIMWLWQGIFLSEQDSEVWYERRGGAGSTSLQSRLGILRELLSIASIKIKNIHT